MTVCPALIIMADDMLADARPFPIIRGRRGVSLDGRVLDGNTQAVYDPRADGKALTDVFVGQREVIIGRIILVRGEILEDTGNVHIFARAEGIFDIVQTDEGESRLDKLRSGIVDKGFGTRTGIHAVKRPDPLADRVIKSNLDIGSHHIPPKIVLCVYSTIFFS